MKAVDEIGLRAAARFGFFTLAMVPYRMALFPPLRKAWLELLGARIGAKVILQCQKPLLPILARTPGVDRLVALLGGAAPTPAGATWSDFFAQGEPPRIDDFGNVFFLGSATDGVCTRKQIVRVSADGGTELVVAQEFQWPPSCPYESCLSPNDFCLSDLSNPTPNALPMRVP